MPKTYQASITPAPAALASRLLLALWRLPAGNWQLCGDKLRVRHGSEEHVIAILATGVAPAQGQALVELLEALPALLEWVAPLPPRPPAERAGRIHRAHQAEVIQQQQAEILALREALASRPLPPGRTGDAEVTQTPASPEHDSMAEIVGALSQQPAEVQQLRAELGRVRDEFERVRDELERVRISGAAGPRNGSAANEPELRRALDIAAREETMLRELVTALLKQPQQSDATVRAGSPPRRRPRRNE